jgi:hypothetical protein
VERELLDKALPQDFVSHHKTVIEKVGRGNLYGLKMFCLLAKKKSSDSSGRLDEAVIEPEAETFLLTPSRCPKMHFDLRIFLVNVQSRTGVQKVLLAKRSVLALKKKKSLKFLEEWATPLQSSFFPVTLLSYFEVIVSFMLLNGIC